MPTENERFKIKNKKILFFKLIHALKLFSASFNTFFINNFSLRIIFLILDFICYSIRYILINYCKKSVLDSILEDIVNNSNRNPSIP